MTEMTPPLKRIEERMTPNPQLVFELFFSIPEEDKPEGYDTWPVTKRQNYISKNYSVEIKAKSQEISARIIDSMNLEENIPDNFDKWRNSERQDWFVKFIENWESRLTGTEREVWNYYIEKKVEEERIMQKAAFIKRIMKNIRSEKEADAKFFKILDTKLDNIPDLDDNDEFFFC